MKTLKKLLLIILLSIAISFAGCKKDSTTSPDPSVQSTAMLKNYQDASKNNISLFNYHQHALVTGNHDSCYVYWHQFQTCESLMHTLMQGYNMTRYFLSQANQSYSVMMALREDHYNNHNYHW